MKRDLLYQKRAAHYDITARLYDLIGVRQMSYRESAIEGMNLRPGSRVLEIGCGTGINLPLLENRIGSTGQIVGLDLSDAMLAKARSRIHRTGWSNVTLLQGDGGNEAGEYGSFDAVLCSFVLSTFCDPELVLRQAQNVLRPGGRLAILDVTYSSYKILNPLALWLTRYFGVTDRALKWRPTEWMKRELTDVSFKLYYLGFIFVASGETPGIRTGGSPRFCETVRTAESD